MVDVSTQKLLGSHDLFKCLALCPASDCYNVVGQNSGYDILKYNLRNHYQKKHGQPAENFDFMVIVPPENFPQPPRVHQTMLENVVAKVEDPDNPPVDDDYDTDRVPTVAEFTPERSNTSFSQKGYYGPYYCLREGCGFMCDKFGLTTQKLLVNHWSMEHGDVRTLLYLDISSFTILNVKVICNNVGYCSYAGCDHIMYGSRKADFPTSVANHWKNTHPSPGNSYNPNMCKVISGKQVPTIREEEAVDMVQKLNLKGVGRLTTHSTYDLEEGRTPARSSTRISPRKLEQGARNYFEEDYEDSMMEDNEDAIDHEGPYQCCECSYTVSLNIASNRAVLNHWVLEHGSPDKLRFVDQPTGEVLTATTFFTTVGKCVRCDYVLGNNRYEADMYRRIGIHWEREHSQEPECSDQQKLEIIDLDDGESVCSEDSDLVDPDMIYNGPFECVVDNCGEQVDHTKTGWKMKCMNHFLQEHDHVINQLRIRDIQSGRVLKIQHLFQYVGQCHQEDCHMIKGINARNKKDGNFELRRTFQNHYKSEHPQVEKVDFTVLVDNHEVKFVTENGKKKTSERSVQSTEVSNNIIYRCNFCDKEFPRQDSLSHWNTKHLNTSITMLTYTDTVTNSNVKLKHLMRTVGQCSTCQHYLGSSSTPGLVSAIRSHYSSSHSRNIIPNTPEHYLTMQPPLPPTPHNYGAEGFICKLCDHRTSYKYLFKHWNSVHKADISLMKMLCVKSNTTGGIFTIFPHVGRCTLCQAYYGATTKHHPLKRVAKEHFRALHGSEDEFDESVHMVAVLMEEGSDVVGDGVDVRMSMESVSQGETDGEDVCLLTCSIPGCGEANITSYSNHFSRKHKELPLEMIRVTTDGGKLLTCQDLFNFALKCDLCTFVSVTGHTTIKHARKSVRKHWVRDHQDMDVDDMTFTDIMPADPVQKRENLSAHSPMKKQKMVDNSPLPSSSRYRCVECDKVLVLGGSGGVSLLKHWTEQHPLLPPVTFRVRSVSDGLVVGLRSLYQYIYRCGAPGCQQVSVSYQGERNAVSKVKEHWMRQHNRACEARYSPVTHLGYLCTVHGCTTVLDMQEDLPQHHTTHQEVLPRDMAVRDLETQQVLMVGDIFSWVSECPADCGAIFFSNTDEDSVTRAGEEHWDQEHGDMPRVGGESARGGYQCMAGADDGEVGCSTVIPEGNNGNALRHWQYKHSCLPLRDLVFMNQSSGAFLQISDVFSRVLVCTHQNCGLVTYTNYLNRGGRVMATHWEKDHGSMEEQGDIFDNMDTLTFLASNHNITHEEFVDFEHEEDFANVANDNLDDDVVIDDTSGVDDPEVTFEELQVVGYKCVVPDCQKVVAVSRFSTAMVALNRLKSHFSKMHRDLPSDEFKYETRYNHDLVNAVSVVVEDIPAPAPPPPPPPAPEYPSIVYKCPGLLKGAKPCPEKMMDANALRIHWGSQHNVDGQTFSPQQISIHDTSHYMCSAQGCEYRILTIGPLRTHWDREHQDHPNRFQVVYNEVKMIKPVVPVPVEVVSEQPKQEAVAEAEEADEAPMIPVGRKTKVPPLPSGCSLQCGVSGCSYQTESSRDMELHSRLCGQPWYVCQTRGCGHRVLGISAIKEHMEVVHTSVKVEDWDYKEVSSRKRSRSSSSGSPGPVSGPSHSGQASPKKAKVECDVSANFDLTGLDGDTTGDSDSDFDLDYTVV